MPDPHFTLYSPGSRRHVDFEEAGELQLLVAEVRRTHDRLAVALPGKIAKGGATPEEADALLALWQAIADDLDAQHAGAIGAGSVAARHRRLRQRNGVPWSDKVEALRREIQHRRDYGQGDVDKGQLTAAEAREQLERLEAVHYLYWRHGFAFDGSSDELRQLAEAQFQALFGAQAA